MQKTIIAGDSIRWTNAYLEYPASAGWLLSTRLVPVVSGAIINLNSVAIDDQYLTAAPANDTENWVPGVYAYSIILTKVGERVTIEQGRVEILPNAASATVASDTRSHVEKTLAAIEAVLEGRATQDVQEYAIGDRQLKHIPLAELLAWRDKYKAQLNAEIRANSASKTFGRKIHMRF